MHRSHKEAFTLIELLIVTAIIAIIAAILFPVFAQARERARATTCLSNARQVGTAMLLYMQDYDEVLLFQFLPTAAQPQPASPDPFLRNADVLMWTQLIRPYLKSEQVLYCPSFDEQVWLENAAAPSCDGPWVRRLIPARSYYSHFGLAAWPAPGVLGECTAQWPRAAVAGNFPGVLPVKRLAQVVRPAETAILQDNATFEPRGGGIAYFFGCEGGFQGAGRSRHRLGANYLFLDGHARLLSLNPEREPLIACPGAQIMNKAYPDCVCARYETWDY
jgi:prepilin-type N-terminal cleavage/methylation domain-containing protein/prepilin-type processing-associated H-X9-DG protein